MAIDYEALAKQAGATSSEPSEAIDYEALVKQAGGVSSSPEPTINREKPSAIVRFGAGLNDIVQGARVIGHRIVGDASGADKIVAENQKNNAIYEAGRGPNAGIDAFRIAGNIAGTVPLGGVLGAAGKTVGGLARAAGLARAGQAAEAAGAALEEVGTAGRLGTRLATGGTVGATAGALTGSGEGRGVQDTVIGAGTGALFGATSPAINAAIGGAAKKIIGIFKTAPTQEEIEAKLSEALAENGVDYAKLSDDVKQILLSKVTDSVKEGGYIKGKEAARLADFEELGLPSTKGQITRDPQQYSFEKNAAKQSFGQPIADVYEAQNKGLQDTLSKLRTSIAPEETKQAAGQKAIDALSKIDNERKDAVGKLYDAFRADAGNTLKVDGVKIANDTFEALEAQSATADLPASLANALNQLSTGKVSPTVIQLDALNHAISRATSSASPSQKFAIGILKDNIDQAVTDAAERAGSNVSEKLSAARAAARDRFKTHEDIPALRAAVQESIDPEDFVKKFVTSGKNADLERLSTTLKTHAPETFDSIRAQVIDDIIQKSVNGTGDTSKFSQAGFSKALKSIDPDKIKILFNDAELNQLNRIARVAAYANNDPINSSVNYSNSAITFFNQAAPILDIVGNKIPLFGRLAVKAIRDNAALGKVQNAVKPASITTPGKISPEVAGRASKVSSAFGYNPASSAAATGQATTPEVIDLLPTQINGNVNGG